MEVSKELVSDIIKKLEWISATVEEDTKTEAAQELIDRMNEETRKR
jgi:hypothetical protein